jgi:hypothetical protein
MDEIEKHGDPWHLSVPLADRPARVLNATGRVRNK